MSKVVILSGAGISAESGISTFRDSGGLWEQYNIKDICTSGCLETNREQTIEFYDKRRANIKNKVPYGDRSNSIIEPFLTEQWFVDAKKLSFKAKKIVKSKKIKFFLSSNFFNNFSPNSPL